MDLQQKVMSTLGRGLDFFEKYNTYSIASSRQDMRKCKEFTATFMKSEFLNFATR